VTTQLVTRAQLWDKIDLTSSGWQFTSIYRFCSSFPSCSDGANPYAEWSGIEPKYGTTISSGANDLGLGKIFQLNPSTGAETLLHSFAGGADGALPYAGLWLDGTPYYNSILYGVTSSGGA
jgi:uncharacterized repeat protein (TIGR03803 family)